MVKGGRQKKGGIRMCVLYWPKLVRHCIIYIGQYTCAKEQGATW